MILFFYLLRISYYNIHDVMSPVIHKRESGDGSPTHLCLISFLLAVALFDILFVYFKR